MDIRMPQMDGLEATRRIVADQDLAAVKVLVLTTFDEDELVVEAIRAGAAGYLLKDVSPGDLRHAIRVVAAGDPLLAPSAMRAVMRSIIESHPTTVDDSALRTLTDREREVLALVGRGLSNNELASSGVTSHRAGKPGDVDDHPRDTGRPWRRSRSSLPTPSARPCASATCS